MKKKYYTELSNQHIFSLYESSKVRRHDCYRNHYHTEAELGLVLRGKGEYVIADKSFSVKNGDFLLIRSNERHCIPNVTEEPFDAFNIQLTPYFLWDECSDYISADKIQAFIDAGVEICHIIKNDKKIISSFVNLERLYKEDSEKIRFEVRKAVLELVIYVSGMLCSDDVTEALHVTRLEDIQKSINFIKHNYKSDISLDDIAASAAMSRSYFSNSFKAVTGISPYSYLMTTRIEKAVEALRETDETVMNIALECGFSNLAAFNKAFKAVVGITPTELRGAYK